MRDDIYRIRDCLDAKIMPAHKAGSIGSELYELRLQAECDEGQLQELVNRFLNRLSDWGLNNLLAIQVGYARDLAASPGALEYEEMHKLFSLCDEVWALQVIGVSSDGANLTELESSVKDRFLREPRKARLVAEDRVKEWNRDYWWYSETLRPK